MIDDEVLNAVSRLVGVDDAAAKLMRNLWADRDRYERALYEIAEWDMRHAEALSVQRAVGIAREALGLG